MYNVMCGEGRLKKYLYKIVINLKRKLHKTDQNCYIVSYRFFKSRVKYLN